ncbi:alcohol dehydrogenase catalytic domain-containing protein [Dictyobacter arantiisoli]|uniref:Alcohol dehydrogenase n=1 Tax=Dictyobacter arantiisoli TaxID=2014874 RepID=A0A5A5TJJ4_9CHLR|nr:alcohol dehydrogenase catalytic domain-containing protein [Dictyobacter arantiisoli]GCF11236.1 alcohol dehydrogenase [Dictyobacter arantiisoli]
MKAVRYYGPQDVRVEEVPKLGKPKPDEVLLQILAASICGTDASQYRHPTMIPLYQTHPVSGQSGPVTLGHEVVGRVIEKGSAVEHLQIGERVVPGSGWWCGECPPCRAGRINICERYFLYGIQAHGGLAEQALFPAKMCVRVPAGCSNMAAALAQPTAVALHAVNRIRRSGTHSIALFGAGNIGSLLLAVLQAQKTEAFPLIVIDIDPGRLATAQLLGASHLINAREQEAKDAVLTLLPEGVDIAIEATGLPAQIQQALTVVRRGGILLQVGIPSQPVELSLETMVTQEKTILSSNGQICPSDLPAALDLFATTDLATRLRTRIITLDRVVPDGLLPLVEHRAQEKVIVVLDEKKEEEANPLPGISTRP